MAIAQVLQMCFFAGLVIAIGGKRLLPQEAQKMIDDHPLPCMVFVFMCNMISGQMLNTGAFEISYNGQPVWSKIDSGRFPNIVELKDALNAVAFD